MTIVKILISLFSSYQLIFMFLLGEQKIYSPQTLSGQEIF